MDQLKVHAQSGTVQECFNQHAVRRKDALCQEDFAVFLSSLFTDFGDLPEQEKKAATSSLFETFDLNRDGGIDFSEFESMWAQWVQLVLCPKWAFIVVDVQNDFITGTLTVTNIGDEKDPASIVPVINDLLENVPWEVVVFTYDWHPADHISFVENKECRSFHASSKLCCGDAKVFDTVVFADKNCASGCIEQTLWPAHCVQNTWGSELHKDLKVADSALKIYKGMSPDVDSYSAFWDNDKRSSTVLDKELKARGVTHVAVCGLALDVCVASTALHAVEIGYGTVIVDDASCGTAASATEATKESLRAQHCIVLKSPQVKPLVCGEVRPLELGLQLAAAVSAKTK